jgi:hypothetical protein
MQVLRKIKLVQGISLLLILGLLVFGGFGTVFLLISIVITYLLLNNYLSDSVFDTRFFRVIVAVVLYFIILQNAILSVWLVHHNFPLNQAIFASTLLLGVSYAIGLFSKDWQGFPKRLSLRVFSTSDAYSVLLALLIVLLVLAGPVRNALHQHKLGIPALTISYINTSLDDSSHLSLLNDRLQLNRGVFYKTNVAQLVVHQNLTTSYPTGWHSANAAAIKALDPGIRVGGQSAIAYVITKIFWLFVLVYLFCRVTISLFSLLLKSETRNLTVQSYIWIVASSLFFAYYILLEQFKEGFYNFIPVLIGQLIILALLLQLGNDRDVKNKTFKYGFRALLPLVIALTGVALAWILLLPAGIIVLLVAIFAPLREAKTLKPLQGLWLQLRSQVIIFALAALAILIQSKVITAGSSRSFRQGIDEVGSITAHSVWYFIFAITGVMLFYGLLSIKVRITEQLLPYIVSLLASILFIYLFQIVTVHHTEYYFVKTLNTLMIIAIPVAITGWGLLLRLIALRYGYVNSIFMSCGLVFLLPLIIGIEPLNTSNLGYIKGDRGFTFTEDSYMYKNMAERAKVNIASRRTDTIFFTPGLTDHNIIATNIIRSIQPVDTCDDKMFTQLLKDNVNGLFDTVSKCQSSHLTIVTSPQTYDVLRNLVSDRNLNNKVTIQAVQ